MTVDRFPRPSDGREPNDRGSAPVRPSTVKLPERPPYGVLSILDFFLQRFPRVSRATWLERFAAGKVWTDDGPIDATTPYRPLSEVHYRREVEREPAVREDFRVVWSDPHLMVVDKPPNLPVTPGGRWVQGCLLHLLLDATGNRDIVPLHRLDRLTSGLVLLSIDPATRSHFARLFQPRSLVEKTYTAVCELSGDLPPTRFQLADRVARSPGEYWRQVVVPEGPANARCEVEVMAVEGDLILARVRPTTGRKHQIRVQLAHAGLPILGDPLYGTRPSYDPGDLSQRLWLDAHRLKIRAFPGPPGDEDLTADWTSSRPPKEFLQSAARWRDQRASSSSLKAGSGQVP
jgi:tRNA pseudouridine32 synthase/23S rRNA pseudouridine746 synthase